MPGRNIQFGLYGARGVKGSQAVAQKLDELAGGIATPVTEKRGFLARVRYLTRSGRQREAARRAGFDVKPATVKNWFSGKSKPSRKSVEAVDRAYREVRRANVARHLKERLNREGRGTRVEIHPLNQSQVSRPRQRVVEYRHLNVRRWDRIVDAWEAGDEEALDDAWVEVIVDLGSQWGQYEYVTSVGFSA
ncbi:XRE family transcriptional regulator [Streptomyces sp. FBKL.4005]|uniref:Helix-turn-helix transcriptional regulator n=1 Tax=Streptomyces tricolor TaxID=68277 RepID=A0ABS9JUZ2_9ACTN|nr:MULTISPECIES: helix-turn-helix transcriptional regulator [Streptomyces]MCG0069368.1 helix-turn-helix transcriptional regulator [Streptomyces tricolor]OYP10165.1 XRE family transcriptional regulator [Streptomyces sp. FBKL.4005]